MAAFATILWHEPQQARPVCQPEIPQPGDLSQEWPGGAHSRMVRRKQWPLYVYTLADAGKAKRLRNNPRARIAPCDMRGRVTGEWADAEARFVQGEEATRANDLLDRKYWKKTFFNITIKLR